MTRKYVWAAVVAAVLGAAVACGTSEGPPPATLPGPGDERTASQVGPDAGEPGFDAGVPDTGDADGGEPGQPDAGVQVGAGPWPTEGLLNYTDRFKTGWVHSVGVDDAYNIWLLRHDEVGVIRPGTDRPVWVRGVGQAAPGFGDDKLARGSTVICGGEAGQAYVGYWAPSGVKQWVEDPNDPDLAKGDMDVVQLHGDGSITLLEHLHRSTGTSHPWPPVNTGIRNSNNWQFNEDYTILTCKKVMRGRDRGELYIGTNHGVTRIRGLVYNSHRHPAFIRDGRPYIGYSYGLGIALNGDVLIANEWKIAILPPPENLEDWEDHHVAPWALITDNHVLNTEEEMDYWRAFEQTADGQYYLGSFQYGLWRMERTQWTGSANWHKLGGLPTEKINAMAATDDGSLFIGTDDQGLWVMGPDKSLSKVSGVPGKRVRQLVYDPTLTPTMLYVVIDEQLFVLRGH
jgi:hypothetical protein